MRKKQKMALAIDTETTGLNLHHKDRLFVISTCDEEGRTGYWEWPVNPKTRMPKISKEEIAEVIDEIKLYETLVFHNAKFDVKALSLAGIKLGRRWKDIHDTLLMSHVIDSVESHKLKDLALRYLGIMDDDETELLDQVKRARRKVKGAGLSWKVGKGISDVKADFWLPAAVFAEEENAVERYAIQDVVRTIGLFKLFRYGLETEGLTKIYERERTLLPVIYRMEERGITISSHRFDEKKKRHQRDLNKHKKAMRKLVQDEDFNPNSSPQLTNHLFKTLKLPVTKKTATGSPSTDSEAITSMLEGVSANGPQGTFLRSLKSFKSAKTTLGYLKNYEESWLPSRESNLYKVLYPRFNQTGTRTTRFSSSNPNGQNIGNKPEVNLREVFGPLPGESWYCIDYSQLELRVIAIAANETGLQAAFERGEDAHQYTADLCNKRSPKGFQEITRKVAKTVNFAIIYGSGDVLLEKLTGVQGIKKIYFDAYPGLARLMRKLGQKGRKEGKITTRMGYPLKVSKDKEYAALNYHIQGWAGDILKNSMIEIDAKLPKTKMIMTIHDELVFAIPNDTKLHLLNRTLKKIQEIMVGNGEKLGVHTPVTCSLVTDNWSEKKDIVL